MKKIFEKIWKKLFTKSCNKKEYIKVDKKMFKDLLIFVKECSIEGNCGASMFVRKYQDNEEWKILKK